MIRGSRLTDRASAGNAKERKRLKKLNRWPSFYDDKIDLAKTNRAIVDVWIEERVTSLLGFEDEVLVGTIQNTVMDSKSLDPLDVQKTLEPFLAEKTHDFMKELWAKLLASQSVETPNLEKSAQPTDDFLAKYEKERARTTENPPVTTSMDSSATAVERQGSSTRRRRRSSSSSSESSHERRARRRRRRRRDRERSSSSE